MRAKRAFRFPEGWHSTRKSPRLSEYEKEIPDTRDHVTETPQISLLSPSEPKSGSSGLIASAIAGDLKRVKELIADGVPVDSQDENGHCALAVAAICGRKNVVKALLAAKASPDAIHADLAAVKSFYSSEDSILDVLLKLSKEINTKYQKGNGALRWAVSNGNKVLVKALLLAGASTLDGDYDGDVMLVAAENGNTELVKLLLEAKSPLESQNGYRATALGLAAHEGHLDTVKLLLDARASTTCITNRNKTPLMFAVQHGNMDVVRLLLPFSMECLHWKDKGGKTALWWARERGLTAPFQALIEACTPARTDSASPDSNSLQDANSQIGSKSHQDSAKTNSVRTPRTTSTHDEWYTPPLIAAAYHGQAHQVLEHLRTADHSEIKYKGKTAMSHACERGHLNVVKVLAEARVDVNVRFDSKTQKTPLLLAVARGDAATVEALIQAGAHLNSRDKDGVFPLSLAARDGNIDCLRVLIAAKAELNMRNRAGETVLFEAVRQGEAKVVLELINAGLDVNTCNNANETALFVVSSAEAAEALIAARADVNARDEDGCTPLMHAAVERRVHVLNTLLKAGADVNAKSPVGVTALSEALDCRFHPMDSDIVKALLEAKADVNIVDNDGYPLLQRAVTYCRDVSITKMLLEAGASVNARDGKGETALIRVLYHDNLDILSLLISHGADLNARNAMGETALVIAVYRDSNHTMKMLLDAGAEWDTAHPAEIKAFIYVCRGEYPGFKSDDSEFLQEISPRNEDASPDFSGWSYQDESEIDSCSEVDKDEFDKPSREEAVEEKDDQIEVIKLLIDAKANVNPPSIISEIPLVASVKRPRVLQMLLNAGAHVNARGLNGETALMAAVKTGAQDSVKLLLQAKADVNIMDFDHVTALKYALKKNDVRTMRLLVDAGAQVEMGYSPQVSPLFHAISQGNSEMVRVLLDGKADVLKLDKYGRDLLKSAVRENDVLIIKYLLDAGLDVKCVCVNTF